MNTPLTEKELGEIAAVAARASRGLWYPTFGRSPVKGDAGRPEQFFVMSMTTEKVIAFCGFTHDEKNRAQSVADARFIANARTDVDRLLAHIEYLNARIHDMQLDESGAHAEADFSCPALDAVAEQPYSCIECGKPFEGEGRLCARCYVSDKL